ncbi:MAG: NAD-dependent epimerase/dehydratase family protein [Pseudonocardiaceae bacterium]
MYGQQIPATAADPRLATRLDYDAIFGTVLNRFVVQAVLGHPLTVYGSGGQTRGLIDIQDTVDCIRLACESPATPPAVRQPDHLAVRHSAAPPPPSGPNRHAPHRQLARHSQPTHRRLTMPRGGPPWN